WSAAVLCRFVLSAPALDTATKFTSAVGFFDLERFGPGNEACQHRGRVATGIVRPCFAAKVRRRILGRESGLPGFGQGNFRTQFPKTVQPGFKLETLYSRARPRTAWRGFPHQDFSIRSRQTHHVRSS